MAHAGMQKRRYRFGEYLFDPSNGLLRVGRQTITLRPKIADLLEVLLESAPEVVSKEELIARVWPDTNVVESGLARNINELRKSLPLEPGAIVTVSKRGYRFAVPIESAESSPPETSGEATVDEIRRSPRTGMLVGGVIGIVVIGVSALLFHRNSESANRVSVPIDPAEREIAVQREFQLGFRDWGLWSEEAMRRALVHFRHAGTLDTRLWYGFVGIAESYVGLVLLTGRADPEWIQWARLAAERAVQLDPTVAVAHTAAGEVRLIADWDWAGAEKSFETALECNAFSYIAYQRRGILRALQGRFDEARQDLRKSRELQPNYSDAQVFSGWAEFCARNFDQAIEILEDLPSNPGKRQQSLRILAAAYGMKGQFQKARGALRDAHLPAIDELRVEAWMDAVEGNTQAAEERLARMNALCGKQQRRYCDTAVIEAALGHIGEAIASLEKGIEQRYWKLLMMPVDPRLESLHDDPRWLALCSRVRNPKPI